MHSKSTDLPRIPSPVKFKPQTVYLSLEVVGVINRNPTPALVDISHPDGSLELILLGSDRFVRLRGDSRNSARPHLQSSVLGSQICDFPVEQRNHFLGDLWV